MQCLESLSYVQYENFSVTVVDNGSKGNDAAQVRSAYPRTVIIETGRNLGFTGGANVDNDDLRDLLNDAKVMRYAPRLEPLGFVLLEATACGLPVVAVAEGGVRETVVDGMNGLLVENKPDAMAAAVQRLLDDPVYAAQIGRVGRQRVAEHWSLPASIDRLEAALAEAARDRSRNAALYNYELND